MPSNVLCSYHSLAYAVIGHKRTHVILVQDVLEAFMANPHEVLWHTKMGKQGNPNFSLYKREMRNAAVVQKT